MGGELAAVAAEATPFAVAAARTYGKAVLAKASDDVADVSVKAGVRLLQSIFGRRKQSEQLPAVIIEVIKNPDDEDYVAQLRLAIRKALENDEAVVGETTIILKDARDAIRKPTQKIISGRDSNVNFFARDGFVAGRDIKFFGHSSDRLPSAGHLLLGGSCD
jgi:hypothetical protein